LTVFVLPGHHRRPVRRTLPHRRPPSPRWGCSGPPGARRRHIRRRDPGLSRTAVGRRRSMRAHRRRRTANDPRRRPRPYPYHGCSGS